MNHRAWLTLAHAYVSAKEFRALLQRFGALDDIVKQSQQRLCDAGLANKKAAAIAAPKQKPLSAALDWLNKEHHDIVVIGSREFPELLAQIPGPPLLLYVNGDIDALHLPALSIIGSRNPTQGGVRNATDFARHLGRCGFAIVSGLAQGIDTASHLGALDGGGKTVAFLGHGIDRVYPSQNHDLAHRITTQGALVSEYPHGAAPERHHFPERNRLISGLSVGTLVIEAARRSGSLITARLAAEQGREVFALPGSIHNPLARGCHELIRQGAKLVETAADIASELAPLASQPTQSTTELTDDDTLLASSDRDYVELRKFLSHDPIAIDELQCRSGLTIEQLSSMLLLLELHGEVESMSGGRYALKV